MINKTYLKQIFQVGIPAGIQSTVINFSNVLLQSSVNSFGSTAMAGYTAANNIFGFLYVAVNSVTQACMSFTSQNYGVRKYKRMDKVLIDCIIISMTTSLVLGCSAYFFGPEILKIVYKRFGSDPLRNGNPCVYHGTVFPVWNYGSVSGRSARNGAFRCPDDPVGDRNGRNQNCVDLRDFPISQISFHSVYFLSGILDTDDRDAGDLFLFCEEKGTQ